MAERLTIAESGPERTKALRDDQFMEAFLAQCDADKKIQDAEDQIAQHLERLEQRALYLGLRVRIKAELGWENQHDKAEQDALIWALAQVKP